MTLAMQMGMLAAMKARRIDVLYDTFERFSASSN